MQDGAAPVWGAMSIKFLCFLPYMLHLTRKTVHLGS